MHKTGTLLAPVSSDKLIKKVIVLRKGRKNNK